MPNKKSPLSPSPNLADHYFDLADQVALVSSELLRFRLKNRANLSPENKAQLESTEEQLDKVVAKLRAQGIAALVILNEADRLDVIHATANAQSLLRRIRRIDRALGIAADVLNLALAISQGQVQSVAEAMQKLRKSLQDGVSPTN